MSLTLYSSINMAGRPREARAWTRPIWQELFRIYYRCGGQLHHVESLLEDFDSIADIVEGYLHADLRYSTWAFYWGFDTNTGATYVAPTADTSGRPAVLVTLPERGGLFTTFEVSDSLFQRMRENEAPKADEDEKPFRILPIADIARLYGVPDSMRQEALELFEAGIPEATIMEQLGRVEDVCTQFSVWHTGAELPEAEVDF